MGLRDELLTLQADFKQTKQNTLKRLLQESRVWLEETCQRRRWELSEEFERDEKMRKEDTDQQAAELEERQRQEEQVASIAHTYTGPITAPHRTTFTEPSLHRHCTVTLHCTITALSPLSFHRHCTITAPSLHHRCTVAAPSQHCRCIIA